MPRYRLKQLNLFVKHSHEAAKKTKRNKINQIST